MSFYERDNATRCRKLGAALVVPSSMESDVFLGWVGAMTTTTGDEMFVAIRPALDGSALLVMPKSRFPMGSTG